MIEVKVERRQSRSWLRNVALGERVGQLWRSCERPPRPPWQRRCRTPETNKCVNEKPCGIRLGGFLQRELCSKFGENKRFSGKIKIHSKTLGRLQDKRSIREGSIHLFFHWNYYIVIYKMAKVSFPNDQIFGFRGLCFACLDRTWCCLCLSSKYSSSFLE